MGGLIKTALRNPPAAGAVVGAVIGIILGLVVDYVVFHHGNQVRAPVLGAVAGGVLGWWQHKTIAGFPLKRISPL